MILYIVLGIVYYILSSLIFLKNKMIYLTALEFELI